MRTIVSQVKTRIISDIHYGDRVSAVGNFAQLSPLLEDTDTLILNGDTIDTRPGPNPGYNHQLQEDLQEFTQSSYTEIKLLTGNHDTDISPLHFTELAQGSVVVTHGDIIFSNIVPWGRDAALARELVEQALGIIKPSEDELTRLLQAHRQAAAKIPQYHQSERNVLRYYTSFLTDTIWPPTRFFHILNSWRKFPLLGQALLSAHRAKARFLVSGHTHWPGVWSRSDGRVCINTGSYCPPCGRLMVELTDDQLVVRRILIIRRDFHPGQIIAQFALTQSADSNKQV